MVRSGVGTLPWLHEELRERVPTLPHGVEEELPRDDDALLDRRSFCPDNWLIDGEVQESIVRTL